MFYYLRQKKKNTLQDSQRKNLVIGFVQSNLGLHRVIFDRPASTAVQQTWIKGAPEGPGGTVSVMGNCGGGAVGPAALAEREALLLNV